MVSSTSNTNNFQREIFDSLMENTEGKKKKKKKKGCFFFCVCEDFYLSITASDSDNLTKNPSINGINTSSVSDTTNIWGWAREFYQRKKQKKQISNWVNSQKREKKYK